MVRVGVHVFGSLLSGVLIVVRFPTFLHAFAVVSLALAFACAIIIALDELRRPQKMAVMNIIWPLTELFGSALWLALYYRWGRGGRAADTPVAVSVFKGVSHYGAGCTLGDIIVEGAVVAAPTNATWFGYSTLFDQPRAEVDVAGGPCGRHHAW